MLLDMSGTSAYELNHTVRIVCRELTYENTVKDSVHRINNKPIASNSGKDETGHKPAMPLIFFFRMFTILAILLVSTDVRITGLAL